MCNYAISIRIILIDKDSDECRQPRRSRKRDLLKRVMSSSHHRSNTIEISESERNFDSPTRDAKSIVSEFPNSSLFFSISFFFSKDMLVKNNHFSCDICRTSYGKHYFKAFVFPFDANIRKHLLLRAIYLLSFLEKIGF